MKKRSLKISLLSSTLGFRSKLLISRSIRKILFSKNSIFVRNRRVFSKNTATTLFKQVLNNGQFYVTTGQLSDQYKEKLAERFLSFDFPEMTNEKLINRKSLNRFFKRRWLSLRINQLQTEAKNRVNLEELHALNSAYGQRLKQKRSFSSSDFQL